jgi:2-polyprenyl-3-methyl-5-hydroxy-6-metoxy-1,4-benzoquinol methylase
MSSSSILDSWVTNAAAWSEAIQQEAIESRKLVTNQAMVMAIAKHQPKSLLDIGCGEGWLCRAAQKAIPSLSTIKGMDAIAALVDQAKTLSPHLAWEQKSFQDLIAGASHNQELYQIISINFALFEKELVELLLLALPNYLSENGRIIIQTLHPLIACGDAAYEEGWREGNWNGFSTAFKDPHPWYFRTMAAWVNLFSASGLILDQLQEPIHLQTGKPASIIFELVPRS